MTIFNITLALCGILVAMFFNNPVAAIFALQSLLGWVLVLILERAKYANQELI